MQIGSLIDAYARKIVAPPSRQIWLCQIACRVMDALEQAAHERRPTQRRWGLLITPTAVLGDVGIACHAVGQPIPFDQIHRAVGRSWYRALCGQRRRQL